MSSTLALVLRAPGSNCDRETVFALERAGAVVETLHVNALVNRRAVFDGIDVLAIPGGFTFGDDLGAGRILGNKIAVALKDGVLSLVDRGGLVIGICNGFQALVKSGLLPATNARPTASAASDGVSRPEAALARNASSRFEARWTRLRVATSKSPWLPKKGSVFDWPVAHGEGRFVVRDEGVLEALRANDQVALRYSRPVSGEPGVSGDGALEGPAGYPYCPSGSLDDIAGVVDPTGRIFGLMPHPERDQDAWLRPGFWREKKPGPERTGLDVFRSAVDYLKERGGTRARKEGVLS